MENELDLSAMEVLISSVWKDVLKLDEVAPDQNFIDLGGQSLHAVKIAFKCQKLLNKRVTTAQVMRHSTITALAAALM
jgi:acyl carrier protein